MPERLDILDDQGKPTGKQRDRQDIHAYGDWHRTVHVWIKSPDGQVLLQRRASTKEVDPNQWSVSVAGHISAGEASQEAALKEVGEELGLQLAAEQLKFLFTVKQIRILKGGSFVDCEFIDVYLVELDLDVSAVTLQKEEVSAVKWVTVVDFRKMVAKEEVTPHLDEYEQLFDYLQKK